MMVWLFDVMVVSCEEQCRGYHPILDATRITDDTNVVIISIEFTAIWSSGFRFWETHYTFKSDEDESRKQNIK